MCAVPLFLRVLVVVVGLLLVGPSGAAAHEIPADVAVQVYVRPEGPRLRVLVRAPLAAMRDVSLPTRGPGYLELTSAEPALRDAAQLWLAGSIGVIEGSTRLPDPTLAAVRVSLPSDRSFLSYDEALAHLAGAPLPPDAELVSGQALLDALLEYPIESDRSDFALEPAFARLGLRVATVVHFVPAEGGVRTFELHGDPGAIPLDPRWHQAAQRFVESGFLHILEGIDHLLFLLCLVIPLRRVRPLVLVVTAFTAGHSLTLVASALGAAPDALWFPPLVELLIALSIVWMALENIVSAARHGTALDAALAERRWILALAFGLVHGFGFSFALRDTLQLAGSHLVAALVAFNVGVELGQLAVLALLLPALQLLIRYAVAERIAVLVLSALVAHTGWHWLLERGAVLTQFDVAWPALDRATLASVLRWAIAAVILATLLGLVRTGDRNVATTTTDVRPSRGRDRSDDGDIVPASGAAGGGVEGSGHAPQSRL